MYLNPSVSDFKMFFSRDFPFGTDPKTTIQDADVTKAFTFTNTSINQGLFADQGSYNNGYLLLSAHYLVVNLRSSSQGIAGQFGWLENSKGVGSVSQSFSIPDRVLGNPYWAMFYKTNYGAMYMQSILPQLTAPLMVVAGTTLP